MARNATVGRAKGAAHAAKPVRNCLPPHSVLRVFLESDRFCILRWFFSSNGLDNRGVMGLNQSIRDQLAERRQERIGGNHALDELDAYGQVLSLRPVSFGR